MSEPEELPDSEEESGVVPGCDRDADNRVHFSRLKLMHRSAGHYAANVRKYSASQALGRATHSFILEDESKLVCYEGKRDRRTKAYQTFLAQHPNKQIVSPSEMFRVHDMKSAIERDRDARELLRGHRENYMQWEIKGTKAAGTPDVWSVDGDAVNVTELKTDDCTEPESFLRTCERYCYHAKLTWYAQGIINQGLAKRIGRLSIVAVESERPHCVTIVDLGQDVIREGIRLWRGWLAELQRCEAFDHWPGYSPSRVKWSLRA